MQDELGRSSSARYHPCRHSHFSEATELAYEFSGHFWHLPSPLPGLKVPVGHSERKLSLFNFYPFFIKFDFSSFIWYSVVGHISQFSTQFDPSHSAFLILFPPYIWWLANKFFLDHSLHWHFYTRPPENRGADKQNLWPAPRKEEPILTDFDRQSHYDTDISQIK